MTVRTRAEQSAARELSIQQCLGSFLALITRFGACRISAYATRNPSHFFVVKRRVAQFLVPATQYVAQFGL